MTDSNGTLDDAQALQHQSQHTDTSSMCVGVMHRHLSTGKHRTGSKHGSFGFDFFDSIGPDESEALTSIVEPEGRKDGLPEQDPAEMATELYARIR